MIMETSIPHDKTLNRVLGAVDGSEYAKKATRVVVMLYKAVNAELVVFHAIPVPRYSFTAEAGGIYAFPLTQYFESAQKEAQEIVNDAVTLAKNDSVHAVGLVSDPTYSIVESIVQAAMSHNVDLIVLGSRGLSGLEITYRQCLICCCEPRALLSLGGQIIKRA